MKPITCLKCGAKLVSYESRRYDLEERELEIQNNVQKLREKLKTRPRNYIELQNEIKILNSEINFIRKQIGIVKRISHLEDHEKENDLIIKALKKFVTREQFLEAVIDAEKMREENKDEINRLYETFKQKESEYKQHDPKFNQSRKIDLTAHKAITNCDR